MELAVEPNHAWSLILPYTYQTIVTLHLSCMKQRFLVFSENMRFATSSSLSFTPVFPLRERAWVRAIHRDAFKGYVLFCTAPDLAALNVRELLFLLIIYALLKRKKKSSCHPSA